MIKICFCSLVVILILKEYENENLLLIYSVLQMYVYGDQVCVFCFMCVRVQTTVHMEI